MENSRRKLRLVSALYQDSGPFLESGLFDAFIATKDPAELKQGDVVVVWGGADISPALYNKEVSALTGATDVPSIRDQIEWALMQRAKELNIPIIGVCRGAQMLCALAGGYLMQHVNGHGGYHPVITYNGKVVMTNSIHHQMMVPGPAKHEVLAEIPRHKLRSDVYWDGNTKVDHDQEPEFIYFNDVKGFAIQWHPEMMETETPATKFIFEELEKRLA